MSNVTMKSTKQEIMDALKEAEARLKQQQSVIADPAQAIRRADEEACMAQAKEDVDANIFSSEMTEKYTNLVNAIALLEKKLKDQYDVDASLLNLVTVTNAAKQLQISMEDDRVRREREINEQLAFLREHAKDMREQIEAERRRLEEEVETEREREEEEYEYNRDRQRRIEENEYNDKMAETKKALEQARAEAAAVKEDAEAHKEEIDAMRQKIDEFPTLLQEKYDAGFTDGEKKAGKEYGYQKSMKEKEHEYELRERDNQIERLQETARAYSTKIETLEEKLDAAYGQIRELAAKTVESNGSIKVIGGGSDGNNKR